MQFLPENLDYRRWLVITLGIWAALMFMFSLASGATDFGLGETGLYLAERVYAVLAALLSMHVSARFHSDKNS